ncbi:MAG: hypothetical protein U5K27_10315 [Desulfotignum sp.]|nr:hypothetical protein [Desulfotignum sp.]
MRPARPWKTSWNNAGIGYFWAYAMPTMSRSSILWNPAKDFKISSPIGTALPLLAGAVGKAFLSAMPAPEAAAYLKHPSFAPVHPPHHCGFGNVPGRVENRQNAGICAG